MPSLDDEIGAVRRSIPTAVAVLTTRDQAGMVHGVTVGSLAYVSRRPPLLTFCLNRRTHSHGLFSGARLVAVDVLAGDQAAVAERYAGPSHLRLVGDWTLSGGLPAVPGAAIRLVCEVHRRIPAGDHTLFLIQVLTAHVDTVRAPLISFDGGYGSVDRPGRGSVEALK